MTTPMKATCNTRTPDSALLGTVEELLLSGDHGHLEAEPRILAALFGLAALHLDGAAREKSEELRQWFSEEAEELARMDAEEDAKRNSEAAPLRFRPICLSARRKS